MNFTSFDKASVQAARKEIDMKLAELRVLGLDIRLGNISFTSGSFKSKIECSITDGSIVNPADRDKKKYEDEFKRSFESAQYPNAIGKVIVFSGKLFKFVGFRPNVRTKRAIILDVKNGRNYRINFDSIKSSLQLKGEK